MVVPKLGFSFIHFFKIGSYGKMETRSHEKSVKNADISGNSTATSQNDE